MKPDRQVCQCNRRDQPQHFIIGDGQTDGARVIATERETGCVQSDLRFSVLSLPAYLCIWQGIPSPPVSDVPACPDLKALAGTIRKRHQNFSDSSISRRLPCCCVKQIHRSGDRIGRQFQCDGLFQARLYAFSQYDRSAFPVCGWINDPEAECFLCDLSRPDHAQIIFFALPGPTGQGAVGRPVGKTAVCLPADVHDLRDCRSEFETEGK